MFKSNFFFVSSLKLVLFVLLFSTESFSQITNENKEPAKQEEQKEKKEKKEKTEKVVSDSLSGTTYYLNWTGIQGFRNFEDLSVFGSFTKWNDQTPLFTQGINFGVIMPLTNNLSLDLGAAYFNHGEQYNYDDPDTDSSYSYLTKYQNLGVPLKLRFTYGDKLQFFAFAGIAPMNIIKRKRTIEYTSAVGARSELPEEIEESVSGFNLMASGGIGVNYYLNRVGFTLYPEYRYHILNTYENSNIPLKHNMYGLGVNAGILLVF